MITRTVARAWQKYCHFLDAYGWRAQAINTSVLMASADVIAQTIIEKKRSWDTFDKTRTLRFFGCGFCIFGPSMFVWYKSLDKIIKIKPNRELRAAVYKMCMDQILFLPVYLGVYVGVMSLLRRENLAKFKDNYTHGYKPMLIASYQIWPVVQIANFYFVPLKHRIFVMNLVGLLWNTYIGWKAEQEHPHRASEQPRISIGTVAAATPPESRSLGKLKERKTVYCKNED